MLETIVLNIVAFDPGVTTGVAVLCFKNGKPNFAKCSLYALPGGAHGLYTFLQQNSFINYHIVSESFVLRPGVKAPNLEPARCEGVLNSLFFGQTIYQTPSVKATVPDSMLKNVGLYSFTQISNFCENKFVKRSDMPHIRDAIRHVFVHALKNTTLLDKTFLKQLYLGD